MPNGETPANVKAAINAANEIANLAVWRRVWRYPALSQLDAVWSELGPVNDYLQAGGAAPVSRTANPSPQLLVAAARTAVFDYELAPGEYQPGPAL